MTVVFDTTAKRTTPKPAHNVPQPVPVRVNNVTITRDAIVREMQHHAAAEPVAVWQKSARALVIRELLLQEAHRLGIRAEPETEGEGRRETDEEALIRRLIEREVTVPEPDNDTCRRYYEKNRARFRSADIYEASHILFAAMSNDEQARARGRSRPAFRLRCKSGRRRLPASPSPIRAVRRRNRAATSARSSTGRPRPNLKGRCNPSRPARSRWNRSRPATVFMLSGSTASTRAKRCLTRSLPIASPTICVTACAGAPTRSTSRAWCRRRTSRASISPAPILIAWISQIGR